MEAEMIEKVEDLLDDSLDTFNDRKRFLREQTSVIKELAEKNGLDKSQLKRVMSYKHYSGKGWIDNNPLSIDKQSKEKDKLSSIFIKFRDAIIDIVSVGGDKILEPYIKELKKCGITVDLSDVGTLDVKDDYDTIMETIDSACKYQTNIDTLSEEITEVKGAESEEIGFTPKNSFGNIISKYSRISEGKGEKVEDDIQKNIAKNLMCANAFNYLASKIEHVE